jgi:hypothetical protein
MAEIGELGTTKAATSNRRTLRRNTWYFFAEDTILHSHRRENLKSYMIFTLFCRRRVQQRVKVLAANVGAFHGIPKDNVPDLSETALSQFL